MIDDHQELVTRRYSDTTDGTFTENLYRMIQRIIPKKSLPRTFKIFEMLCEHIF